MNTLFTLLAHLLRNIAVVFRPGGSKSIIAENLLLKQLQVIRAIVEFKRRNPRWGCPRIAEQISNTFGIQLD